nr:xylulose kinase-1 [Tanacetum cinerariifolium]
MVSESGTVVVEVVASVVVDVGRYVVPAGRNGNSKKILGRDSKRGIIILPPVSFKEHVAVQRQTKEKTLLLQSLPKDHMADFHYLDDAREIWLAVKARFGGNEESKKMRKTMLKLAFSEFSVSEEEGLYKGYDRALPSSWSQVALTLKTRGGLEYLSFDDLYNKLSIMEDVPHSFVAENEPTQQMAYEDFEQVDEKARYSTFKISEVKTEEPKAMVSVDSMLKWNEHEAKNKTDEAEQVYGLMAVFESDFAVHAGNAAGSVNPAATEFAMMGISPKVQTRPFGCDSQLSALKKHYDHLEKLYNDSFIQVQAYKNIAKTLEHQKDWYHKIQLALEEKVRILSANLENTTNILKYFETLYAQAKLKKKEWEVKFIDSLDRFDKWKESSQNLAKLLYSSMSTRTKLSLRFKEYIRSDEVCDLSTPSAFDSKPENREVKSLCERFVKAGKMHAVPPPITGTFMPTSYKSDLAKTQATFGSNPKTNDSFSTVDVKIFPKSDVKDPSPTNGFPSCSFKENVKPTRNLCNKSGIADMIHCKNNFVRSKKCFICGSKSHLIKDCDVYDTVDNFPNVVSKAASVPASSRNSSASTSADRSILAASRNRSATIHADRSTPAASRNRPSSIHAGRINKPTPFPAGRSVPTGWTNHAARPFFRPTNLYFDYASWPGIYDHMSMNEGRWDSTVKSSADIGIVDSGCSRSMTGNKEKLDDFVQVKGGTVTFRGGDVTGADLEVGTDLVTGADLEVGTDLVAGTDLEAVTDLVKEAGTDLVTQAGTDLVTLSRPDLVPKSIFESKANNHKST